MKKPKLLWVGDHSVNTGYARSSERTLAVLRQWWDVYVLGMNATGDPNYPFPYPVYPAWPGGDQWGTGRLIELTRAIQPDIIVIQQEVWNIPEYMRLLFSSGIKVPVVASVPVDEMNCKGWHLNTLDLVIFWTQFGEAEARKGGFAKRSTVIPLGIDTELYRPMGPQYSRDRLGVPQDIFLVGCVARNQPRKRLDLVIEYFAEFITRESITDARLYLHAAPSGEDYDLTHLATYFGVHNYVILRQPHIEHGIPESEMPFVYSAMDVGFTCTQGEGFGLPVFEGMACGIPQIVPAWSALDELCEDAALKVPCSSIYVTPKGINTIGGVPDREHAINALTMLYRREDLRRQLSSDGLLLVQKPKFRWSNVGHAFHESLLTVLEGRMHGAA